MKCIIVDDDAAARSILRKLCSQSDALDVVAVFPDAIEAMKYLNQHDVDLIFLDIHMPAFTGFDFIQTLGNLPNIIITTSDRNYALDAFEYDCIIDYLVKPISPERFEKAVNKAESKGNITQQANTASSTDTDLYVNIDRRLVKIKIADIYYIQAKGDYIKIVTEEKNHIVHSTLKKIEDKLPNEGFLKVHRSYVINTSRIVDIEDNSVLIKQHIIPVSRANRAELMRRLNLL
jgi:DNA-binding LytR/AlgR family response regulator